MSDVYMVCGVPGSGKTWVCQQVKAGFTYVPHDDHLEGNLVLALVMASKRSDKPLLTECPFGERVLKAKLENHGFVVHPVFVIEDLRTVQERYRTRGRELPKASQTRNSTILHRANEWKCPKGTSKEMVDVLLAASSCT